MTEKKTKDALIMPVIMGASAVMITAAGIIFRQSPLRIFPLYVSLVISLMQSRVSRYAPLIGSAVRRGVRVLSSLRVDGVCRSCVLPASGHHVHTVEQAPVAGLDDTEETDGKAAYRGIRRVSSSMACRCSCPEQGRGGAQSARHNHNDTRDTGDGADDAVVHRVHGADARRADMQYRTVYRDARDESGAADLSHLLSLRAHLHDSGVRQDTRDIQDATENFR